MQKLDNHTPSLSFCVLQFFPTLCFHPIPPTQPLPDTPAPSHLFETHNMVSDTQPTAPQKPSCENENCDKPAQLQCGICTELFFCDTPACYDACHPRKRDRETHRASVTAYGTSSKCAQHPGQELSLVCEDPACGDALICMCCSLCDTHAGHETVDLMDYMKRQRAVLHSHVTDLTAQRADAEEEVCALTTFVAKAGHMIAECEAVCQLGDEQVLRAVTESQAVVRSINGMAACGDRHRLVGAADPHTTFYRKLRCALVVYDAIAALRELGDTTLTSERLKQVTDEGSDPKLACLLLQAGAATAIPDNFFKGTDVTCIDISYASALVVIRDDFLSSCRSLKTVDLSGLQGVTSIGNRFLQCCQMLSTVDLSGLKGVTSIGDAFLCGCAPLRTLDLSGLQSVTSIGDSFLYACRSLTTLNLSGLQAVTSIGNQFLAECISLRTLDLSGLQAVTEVGPGLLQDCTELKTLRGKEKCSNDILSRLPKDLRN